MRAFDQWPKATFWIFFVALCAVLLIACMDSALLPFDEGFVLYGAVRFKHGELPYRDFWTLYGPGQFVVLGTLFKLFGESALPGRLLYVATMLSLSTVMAKLGLMLHGRRIYVIAVAMASIFWLAGFAPSGVYPIFPALLFSLLSVLLMVTQWKRGQERYSAFAGISTGLLLLFRHDLAFWTTLALLLGEVYFHVSASSTKSAASRTIGRDIFLYLAGFGSIVAVAWVNIYRHISNADLYDQLLFYPSHLYKAMRGLPLPTLYNTRSFYITGPVKPPSALLLRLHLERLNDLIHFLAFGAVYLPLPIVMVAFFYFTRKSWRHTFLLWQRAAILALIGLIITMPISGLVRPDLSHQIQSILPALLLCSIFLAVKPAVGGPGKAAAYFSLVAAALLCGVMVLRGVVAAKNNLHTAISSNNPRSPLHLCRPGPGMERARCFYIDPDETATTLFIMRHTAPGDHIFSSGTRTDRLFTNDALLYFLTGRDTPGKWEEMEPGIVNTMPVQMELVRDFERDRVAYVVQDSSFDVQGEPNLSSASSNIFLLDRYIAANYKPAKTFGTKTILERSTPFTGL